LPKPLAFLFKKKIAEKNNELYRVSHMTTPTKTYKVMFQPNNLTIEVDPAKIPYGETGEPGSILDIALANGIGLEHVCGGNTACSTCHVIVTAGGESCSPMSSDELDQLDNASGKTEQSRLSCQCVPNGEKDIIIQIP
jgi:2Fe-2S ferredoxin